MKKRLVQIPMKPRRRRNRGPIAPINPTPWHWRYTGLRSKRTLLVDAQGTVVALFHRHEAALLAMGLVNDCIPASAPEKP